MNAKSKSINIRTPILRQIPLAYQIITMIVLLFSLAGCSKSGGNVLTLDLTEPISSVTTAKVEIDPGDGNLEIDQLVHSEQELASGALQYLEERDQPTHTVDTTSDPAVLTLRANSRQPWFHAPWAACNGATEWLIHLNPKATTDLTAHTDGGNIKLNLAGMVITHLLADTSGGNIEVVLPGQVTNLSAMVRTGGGNINIEIGSSPIGSSVIRASSGAGNVLVRLPGDLAARIYASSGMGKIIVDPRFSEVDDSTYQTLGYDSAANKVEITVESGAGTVTIE